jgi:glucose/mannose transport system substrate-binding protein
MIDPKNQAAFNLIHGSIPARMDAYNDDLDACNKIGVSVVQSSPDNVLPGWGVAFSPDVEGQVYDLLAAFWATSSMTAEDAASQFATIISSDK